MELYRAKVGFEFKGGLILVKKSICALMAITFIAFGSVAFGADDSWKKVEDRGCLLVGFCAAYPPFESRNEKSGEFEGFDVDLGKALAEEMGVSVKFVDGEWQGLIGGLFKGDYDVLMTCMSKSEGRGKNVSFSDVYYELRDVIVVRADDDRFSSEEDLKGMVVGAQQGSGAMQVLDKLDGLKEKMYYNYNPEAFLDLKNSRIDAVIVGLAYAVERINEDPSYRVVAPVGDAAEIVAVMPKGSDDLTAQMNKALASLRSNGKWQALVDRWLSVD
ncbi:ABC transporter substrate-binding protein [Dethiosulfovibrio sp. F2B]|uniref:substrate-binding periplasmic protein n=1 Tax=Dethiosulfovibrio faecalis TaxID=2720018 RepID=UPI001F28884F|nr:ABC transporter substrate-binding protein [Dethiosulfovibrio faecalis]MCF4151255.1 ABC transporter substrate-binding protein [Dethiosulfovibrio faecalis]